MKPQRRLLVGTAVSLAAVFSGGMALHVTGTLAQGATTLPKVAQYFDTAPANCPIANAAVVHESGGRDPNRWVGGGALVGYSDWLIVNHRVALEFSYPTKYGYPTKVFWQVTRSAHGPITLRGWNLRSGQRMWFGHPTANAKLDSPSPGPVVAWLGVTVSRRFAPSLTFVPSAGCYVIKAQWKGGSWSLPFTAGG